MIVAEPQSEHEYRAEIDGLTVEIDKLGGGTLGRAFQGGWSYLVTDWQAACSATGTTCARACRRHTPKPRALSPSSSPRT